MLITDYILNDIKALTLSNTIADAKKLFSELIFTHIPIVENGHLYGLIAESDLLGYEDDYKCINEIRFNLQSFFTYNDVVYLDLIKNFSLSEANILPVLSKNNKYLGYYELSDILHLLSSTPFLLEESNTLIVSKHKSDYSISEIAQIVESNDAKLYGIFVSGIEADQVIVILKIYSDNINDVIHTFRRYDYQIIVGINEDEYLDDLKRRSDYLQKYLNI